MAWHILSSVSALCLGRLDWKIFYYLTIFLLLFISIKRDAFCGHTQVRTCGEITNFSGVSCKEHFEGLIGNFLSAFCGEYTVNMIPWSRLSVSEGWIEKFLATWQFFFYFLSQLYMMYFVDILKLALAVGGPSRHSNWVIWSFYYSNVVIGSSTLE